jgi:hypothetical protein
MCSVAVEKTLSSQLGGGPVQKEMDRGLSYKYKAWSWYVCGLLQILHINFNPEEQGIPPYTLTHTP